VPPGTLSGAKCSYEVVHVHGLWHLDFHQVKIAILDTAGRWHRPMARLR
jgi:hypothetical protein